MSHALVVDDDSDSAETMAMLIANEGFTVATAGSLRDARRQMSLQEPDIVLLDLVLPDGSGMELFNDAKVLPNTEVVLITGHASLDTSIQALRLGAADYLVKPMSLKQLQGVLSRLTKPSALKAEADDLEKSLEEHGHFGQLWGRSASMRRVYQQILRVSGTAVTVFLTGESGTGKEVVAKTVHDLSRRRARPFFAVNCGAISPHLIESEIFGHEKGSFTGADRQHIGFFERTSGGTLFLDEITEMPLDLQVKLLRVLETRALSRIGSDDVIDVDVRVLAASNRAPQDAVAAGRLRRDLLYRLQVFPLHVPPLRERLEDVRPLATHFLDELNKGGGTIRSLTPAALDRLERYGWPGNVRELWNVVQRACILSEGRWITQFGLSVEATLNAEPHGRTFKVSVGDRIDAMEKRLILATVHHTSTREAAAKMLGVSVKTLYNRLREYERGPVSHADDGIGVAHGEAVDGD